MNLIVLSPEPSNWVPPVSFSVAARPKGLGIEGVEIVESEERGEERLEEVEAGGGVAVA